MCCHTCQQSMHTSKADVATSLLQAASQHAQMSAADVPVSRPGTSGDYRLPQDCSNSSMPAGTLSGNGTARLWDKTWQVMLPPSPGC